MEVRLAADMFPLTHQALEGVAEHYGKELWLQCIGKMHYAIDADIFPADDVCMRSFVIGFVSALISADVEELKPIESSPEEKYN